MSARQVTLVGAKEIMTAYAAVQWRRDELIKLHTNKRKTKTIDRMIEDSNKLLEKLSGHSDNQSSTF